jgi:DNA oxidative demethylase
MEQLFSRPRTDVVPGAHHLPDWLDAVEQATIAAACVEWGRPPGGLRHVKVRNGEMSVQTMCLGWHWQPYRYTRICEDTDQSQVKPFPAWLGDLGRRAVADACGLTTYDPDVALINWYSPTAKMGLHQDKDERSRAPVVSISIGDPCVFRFGNNDNRGRPWTDIELRSGDLFVFGGERRMAFHGVTKLLPGPYGGRWNVTLRESGLAG